MKTIITTIAFALSTLITIAQTEIKETKTEGNTITVTIPVKSAKGHIYAALHNEATFMKAAPVLSGDSSVENGVAIITFTNVEVGEYGITLFLDTNDNQRMDFEANGMPKEMYGVSNNVMSYGPPQWGDAKFTVENEPIEMEIRL